MTKITIIGAKGKMGQTLIECSKEEPELQITTKIDVGDDLENGIEIADVVVDFSSYDATEKILDISAKLRKPIVIGTTNLSDETLLKMQKMYSKCIPIVLSPNFSIGVNVLFLLVQKAAELLPDFDLEIVEMHHRHKPDAPSGTAKMLMEILSNSRNLSSTFQHGREGHRPRSNEEIGIHSLRGGDVFGDHCIVFAGEGERLEITHKASSRATFAKGALRAVKWIVGKKPGLYSMIDVLGFQKDST